MKKNPHAVALGKLSKGNKTNHSLEQITKASRARWRKYRAMKLKQAGITEGIK